MVVELVLSSMSLSLMVHFSRYVYGTCFPLETLLIPICRRDISPRAYSSCLFIHIPLMQNPHLAQCDLVSLDVLITVLILWSLAIRSVMYFMWWLIVMKKGISLMNMKSSDKVKYWYLSMRRCGILSYMVCIWWGLDSTVFLCREPLSFPKIYPAVFTSARDMEQSTMSLFATYRL